MTRYKLSHFSLYDHGFHQGQMLKILVHASRLYHRISFGCADLPNIEKKKFVNEQNSSEYGFEIVGPMEGLCNCLDSLIIYKESDTEMLLNDTSLRISVSTLDDLNNDVESKHDSLVQDILLRDMGTIPFVSSIFPIHGSRCTETNVTVQIEYFPSCHNLILCRVMWSGHLIEFPPSYIDDHCKEATCQIPPHISNPGQHYVLIGLSNGINASNFFHVFYNTELPVSEAVGPNFHDVLSVDSSNKPNHSNMVIQMISPNSGPVSGGTSVLIVGINFFDDLGIRCKFGNQYSTGQFISSTEVACITPPQLLPGSVDVMVEMEHGTQASSQFPFVYYAAPRILRFQPHLGPVSGGINVTVTVNGRLDPADHLMCRFDHIEVHGHFLNESAMVCILPPNESGLVSASVVISKNGGHDFSQEGLNRFQYVSSPRILSVTPSYGSIGTKTVLAIKWIGFQLNEPFPFLPHCLFNKTMSVIPSYVSRTEIRCELSATYRVGKIPLQVILGEEGNFVTSNTMMFYLIKDNLIGSIDPDTSSPLGGTEVTLYLEKHVEVEIISCKFGDVIVDTTHYDVDKVSCISPPHSKNVVPLFISFDRDNFYDTGFTISYNRNREQQSDKIDKMDKNSTSSETDTHDIQKVTEKSVPVIRKMHRCYDGNTSASCVSIYGENFSHLKDHGCQIGARYATFKWISNFHVECHADFNLSDSMTVTLGNEGQNVVMRDFQVQTERDFYVHAVHFNAISHIIMVIGQNFVGSSDWTCLINDARQDAKWLHQGELNCKIDPSYWMKTINVKVCKMNTICSERSILKILQQQQFSILTKLPLQGDLKGGNHVHFDAMHTVGSSAKCRFGTEYVNITKSANASSFYCVVPPVTKPQEVNFELSLDGEIFIQTEMMYRYLSRPTISKIHPSRISSSRHPWALRVYGDGFVNIPTPICLFDGEFFGNAVWVSFSEVWCAIPKHLQPGKIDVSVAYEGSNLKTDSSVYLLVVNDDITRQAFSMDPSCGPAGTKIDICASTSFEENDKTVCHFGKDIEIARFTNSFCMHCYAPPRKPGFLELVRISSSQLETSLVIGQFKYTSINIISVTPTVVQLGRRNVDIELEGNGFECLPKNTVCRLGENIISQSMLQKSSTVLVCTFKDVNNLGILTLTLDISKLNVIQTGMQINVVPDPIILSVWPLWLIGGMTQNTLEIIGEQLASWKVGLQSNQLL
eukprot:CAMPEP_0176476670 /NCGR_PEP_ID=MMETSP0200_2-20121128/183_1 /TAXON_ID=947934 /ORGANISM="Chaetoceros sp., Strain GSL56" /LENGTH=1206 /DNA_ID=CAMNT_0017872369 /DNA_START=317 /DNA_END=3937 /DNA_ORIENTATION=-